MHAYTLDALASPSFPWIVSTDTLKPETLLVKYWEAAEDVYRLAYDGSPFAANHPTLAAHLETLAGPDSRESDWSDGQASQCLKELFDILDDHAPAGFYFGSQEGDGAALGFWLDGDWADALEHVGVAADSDPGAISRLISELSDLGYDTPEALCDSYRGEAEGYDEDQAGADAAAMIGEEIAEVAKGFALHGWPFTHIDWSAAWQELRVSDNFAIVQWSHCRWLVLAPC
jgi:hypothetical protein